MLRNVTCGGIFVFCFILGFNRRGEFLFWFLGVFIVGVVGNFISYCLSFLQFLCLCLWNVGFKLKITWVDCFLFHHAP